MKKTSYSRDVRLILAASFFYMASPMLVTPLITGFSENLGASGTLMGLVGGLMNVTSLVCRPVVGNLSDWTSKYKLSFIGAALVLLACVGYTAAQGPGMIVLARIVNGVGFACCSVCMSTWMSNLLPRDKIGSGMGLYGTMNALSMALAPAVGVKLYQHVGYRAAFALAAVFAVVTMLLVRMVEDQGGPTQTRADAKGTPIQLADRNVIPVALIIMLFALPYCATQSFLLRYTESRGLAVAVGLFFPVYAGALLVLRLSLKSLFDRLPFGVFVAAGSVSAALSLLGLARMEGNGLLLLSAVLMAGGYGIMCSVCQSHALLLAGEGRRGLANSTYYIGLDLGMALGPLFGGLLYGHLPIQQFYPMLLLTVPACLVVYGVCWGRKRR